MLDWLKIRLKSQEMEEILQFSVDDPSDVSIKDIKRVFVLINQKQELAPIFKFYAGIEQNEKIKKKKMPMESFIKFLEDIQKETFNEELCTDFFSMLRADNIFNYSKHHQNANYPAPFPSKTSARGFSAKSTASSTQKKPSSTTTSPSPSTTTSATPRTTLTSSSINSTEPPPSRATKELSSRAAGASRLIVGMGKMSRW